MNLRERFVIQTVISLMIFAGVKSISMIDIDKINEAEDFLCSRFEKHYTPEDIEETVSGIFDEINEVHKSVTAAVIEANTEGESEIVLGKKDAEGIQIVYAATGGNVINAGINDKKELFVEISGDDYIYTYCNMSQISVATGERVRKGDIIGTFDNKDDNEFFFEKREVM